MKVGAPSGTGSVPFWLLNSYKSGVFQRTGARNGAGTSTTCLRKSLNKPMEW